MNVVVVIADALRRDMLDGELEPAMPRLSARFGNWYVFNRCFATAPWTLPSCTTLLTGRASEVHQHFTHTHRLDCELLTAGFGPDVVKAAIVNNSVLAESSGLFDAFDEYALLRRHDETFDAAHRFLDARAADGKAYFLLLHTNLAHDYNLHSTREHYEWYYPDRDDWFELGARVLRWQGVSAAQGRTIADMYRACTLALDEQVDRFVARLDGDDTAIAFVADHGEGFDYELRRLHHGGRLHDDVLRVPCAFSIPAAAPASARSRLSAAVDQPVSLADVMPTLLSVAGHDVPADLEGRCLDRIDGHDGRVLSAQDRRYLYLASRQRLNTNSRGKNMTRLARWRNQVFRSTLACDFGLRCVIDGRHKLVVTEFIGRTALGQRLGSRILRNAHIGSPVVRLHGRRWIGLELFDLESDPGERHNVLVGNAALARKVDALVERDGGGAQPPALAELFR